MSNRIRGILFLLVAFTVISVIDGSCPIKHDSQKDNGKPRGYGEPYGYHARRWKRIETLYEHPHPEEFYRKYMRGSWPVIIRGGAKHWPAINKWTNLTYLLEKVNNARSVIQWKNMYSYDRFHPVRVQLTMKEFLRDFEKQNLYMDSTLPNELGEDVHWPHSLGCRFYQKRTKQLAIMFNNGRSSSDLHMDSTCTYFVQVTGSRRWLLSPPDEVAKVYSGAPSLVDHLGVSAVNQTHVDLEKHWLIKNLTMYVGVMNPGDIIYVPEGWHHQVKTYGSPNIGVVNFMNYLLCEFHSDTDDEDPVHVKKCVYRIREQRPKTLKCDAFPEKNMTIPELLQKYPPPKPSSFLLPLEQKSSMIGPGMRILNNGKDIVSLGVSLVGRGLGKNDNKIVTTSLIEGFRLFCINPGDSSVDLLARHFRKIKKLKDVISILAYLPKSDFGAKKAPKAIDSLLKQLNVSSIDFLLMQTDYCPAENGTDPCQRNVFTSDMLDTWKAMEQAHRDGKVKTLGVSDFSLSELKELLKVNEVPVSIARARLDPFFRNMEYRAFCRKEKILFMGRNILAKQWQKEKPDFPENRDITQHYYIKRAAFQYRTSVHGVLYDWATRKGALICPPMDDPLHVRVYAQSFRSESTGNPDNLNNIDLHIHPSDKGLFSPKFANQLKKEEQETEDKNVEVGKENLISESDLDDSLQEQYEAMSKSEKDYSNEVYTDTKDFEIFPSYMDIDQQSLP